MTDDEIAKARELCERATPGPWELWTSNSNRRISGPDRRDGGVLSGTVSRHDGFPDLTGYNLASDLRFIVASRMLVPALLDENARLREALTSSLDALVDTLERLCRNNVGLDGLSEHERILLVRRAFGLPSRPPRGR